MDKILMDKTKNKGKNRMYKNKKIKISFREVVNQERRKRKRKTRNELYHNIKYKINESIILILDYKIIYQRDNRLKSIIFLK
jgi:predicted nucleotidyltransferase